MAKSVTVKTKKATRDLLALFAGNQRMVKLFEDLALDMTVSIPTGMDALLDGINEAQGAADSARMLGALVQAIASQALDLARQATDAPAATPQVFEGFAVGMIAITVDPTNPSLTLGYGVWVQWGSGRVPVSYLAGDPDFGTVEGTGGFKTVSIPDHTPHTHTFSDNVSATPATVQSGVGATVTGTVTNGSGATAAELTALVHKDSRTGASAIPILPPFIVAYFWKRTA